VQSLLIGNASVHVSWLEWFASRLGCNAQTSDNSVTFVVVPVSNSINMKAILCVLLALFAFAVARPTDPLLEWSFSLECVNNAGSDSSAHGGDSVDQAWFTHVDGIGNWNNYECDGVVGGLSIATQPGGEPLQPGYMHACVANEEALHPITLKRFFNPKDLSFWKWRNLVLTKPTKEVRATCTFNLFDRAGTTLQIWTAVAAWPAAVELSPLDAFENTRLNHKRALVETIIMIHEGITHTAPGS